jgi:glycosyltransferase involved in cell wall biosynthesis
MARNPEPKPERRHGKLRIGHLLGLLNPTHAPTKLAYLLTKGIMQNEADSFIYTSEWAAAWFHNWTHRRQSGPENFLEEFKPATLYIHEAEDNFIERARRLSTRIRHDDIDVLIVHSSLSEMITALVALDRPARRLVNINHASEMNLPCFDGLVHMFENGLLHSAMRDIPMVVIPPASDMARRLGEAPRIPRSDFGIPEQSTLSGTFGNLYKIENPAYRESLRAILLAHPQHHHLIAGGGSDQSTRVFLKEVGLENRVHLLGRRTDIPSLLLMLDFYLASHPYPGALSEIEAMAAACPVISVRDQPDSHYNAGAESVGLSECIVNPGDTAAMVALASRYLHDSGWRRSIGESLKRRFEQQFTPDHVVSRHLAFYRSLL